MPTDDAAESEAVYLREAADGWYVGTSDSRGLPVATFAAAIQVADAWLCATGHDAAVVIYADGETSTHSPMHVEGDDHGPAEPTPPQGTD